MRLKLLSVIVALLLFANGAYAVEIQLLHGWGTMEAEHIAMREIYMAFEAVRPDVKLKLSSFPDTQQALKKAGDMLSVGEAPDILFVAGVNSAVVDFMIDKGYALNLMPYILSDAEFKSCVSSLAMDTWATPEGALYTLSDVMWLYGLWMNADILDKAGIAKAPVTWDEFFAALDKIEALGGARAISLTMEDMANLLQLIVAGMDPQSGAADSARLPDALGILKRLYGYAGAEALEYKYRDTLSLFNAGRTAFYVNGIWAGGMISADINAVCLAYPGELGSVSGQVALCGYILGDTGDEERELASVDFVKYMLSAETQIKLMTYTGQFPANPMVNADEVPGVAERMLSAAKAIRAADIGYPALGLYYDEAQTNAVIHILNLYLTDAIDERDAAERVRAIDHR